MEHLNDSNDFTLAKCVNRTYTGDILDGDNNESENMMEKIGICAETAPKWTKSPNFDMARYVFTEKSGKVQGFVCYQAYLYSRRVFSESARLQYNDSNPNC